MTMSQIYMELEEKYKNFLPDLLYKIQNEYINHKE